MNKAIPSDELSRMKRCILDMGNKMNCYQTTGIHYATIDKILNRGYAKVDQINKLLEYCDKVEELTANVE